ncbi:MAG: hypothetical protein H6556_01790 [Lewinellaceae bacterium]|nr:hypothetical protein [Lewinellaceae bacterium]
MYGKIRGRAAIEDNFLHFWFRFIYKNKGTVEIGNFEYLKTLVKRDFPTYSGRFLEKYFTEKLALSGKWPEIGSYWERGFKNQIDIVAINRMGKTALLSEVKRKEKQYSEQQLRSKALQLQRQLVHEYLDKYPLMLVLLNLLFVRKNSCSSGYVRFFFLD